MYPAQMLSVKASDAKVKAAMLETIRQLLREGVEKKKAVIMADNMVMKATGRSVLDGEQDAGPSGGNMDLMQAAVAEQQAMAQEQAGAEAQAGGVPVDAEGEVPVEQEQAGGPPMPQEQEGVTTERQPDPSGDNRGAG